MKVVNDTAQAPTLWLLMREDTLEKKVYLTDDQLLFDFSLMQGDKFPFFGHQFVVDTGLHKCRMPV